MPVSDTELKRVLASDIMSWWTRIGSWLRDEEEGEDNETLSRKEKREILQKHNCRCSECGVHQDVRTIHIDREKQKTVCDNCVGDNTKTLTAPWHRRGEKGYYATLNSTKYQKKGTGEALIQEGEYDDGEVYAGRYPRGIYESERDDILLGYSKKSDRITPQGLSPGSLQEHVAVFGKTGAGKTTLLMSVMIQAAYAGGGFVFVDAKGEDSHNLLSCLPPDRIDDIVWIDPTDTELDRVVSMNPLDVQLSENHPNYEDVVESRVDNIKNMVNDLDTWGPGIDSVFESYLRAALLSKRSYTLLDIAKVLETEERRSLFADRVSQEGLRFIEGATRRIEKIDDTIINAVIRRLESWTQSELTRQTIGYQESSIDFAEIIENNKIVIVRNGSASEKIQRLIAVAVTTEVWAAAQRSRSDDSTPFLFILDEFKKISSPRLKIDSILAQARSAGLGVILATQYPVALSDEIRDDLLSGCNTLVTFPVRGAEDARLLSDRLIDATEEDIMRTKDYHAWMQRDEATVHLKTFPPYPPVRKDEDVDVIINRSLRNYGVERMSKREMHDSLDIGGSAVEGRVEREMVRAVDDLTDEIHDTPTGKVDERLRRRSRYTSMDEEDIEEAELARIRESSRYLETEQVGNGTHVSLTEHGEKLVAEESDTGVFGGGDTHRALVKHVDEFFTALGCVVDTPRQDTNELPDATVTVPDDADELATYLADGDEKLNVEVEATVSKPAQTLDNLKKAVEEDRRCLFVVPEGGGDPVQPAERLEGILNAATSYDGHLYNSREHVEFDDGCIPVIPEGANAVWRSEKDGYVLEIADESVGLDTPSSLDAQTHPYPVVTPYGDGYALQEEEKSFYSDLKSVKDDWNLLYGR